MKENEKNKDINFRKINIKTIIGPYLDKKRL